MKNKTTVVKPLHAWIHYSDGSKREIFGSYKYICDFAQMEGDHVSEIIWTDKDRACKESHRKVLR